MSTTSVTSVTSKGQVTIPQAIRKELGIRQGSQLQFRLVRDRIEVQVLHSPSAPKGSGFGLVRSRKPALAPDFDPAQLLASKKRT